MVIAAANSVASVAIPVAMVIPTIVWRVGPIVTPRLVSRALPVVGAAVSWYFLGSTTTLFATCLLMTT
jgi:hypothetical protein